jgi:hypothetical protein
LGLDSYARNTPNEDGDLTDEQKQAFQNADIRLCGGMFSGNGNDGSFRGKVYNSLIEETTGVSLYEEWIEPDSVAEMSRKLDELLEDVTALQRFFGVCSDEGLGIVGWW